MKIKAYDTSYIVGRYFDTKFVISARTTIQLIRGISGTGKTYFFKACVEAFCDKYDIRAITYPYEEKEFMQLISNSDNVIFTLDRTDLWLTQEACAYISQDTKNKYIIIGRYPRGLILNDDEVTQLKFKEPNIIYSDNIHEAQLNELLKDID